MQSQAKNGRSKCQQDTSTIAEQLDKQLEDELSSCKRTPYTDGWPEDKWREEMEKHPFFMTEAPDPSKELPPLIEGLQQLKYSETENTQDELAKTYKDDGNFYFKCKKYRDAISHYSAGLKLNCCSELKAQLFNNRSASHFFLQNYRSSLTDCEETLKLDPQYVKAERRRAQCLFHLDNYERCIEICDDLLSREKNIAEIVKLKKEAKLKKKLKDRNIRKNDKMKQFETAQENMTLECIQSRNINVRLKGKKKLMKLSDLEPPTDLPNRLTRVYFEDGVLFWPVIYNFPELTLNMPIDEFDENRTCYELLLTVSEGVMEHYPENKFKPSNVRIFFRDENEKLIEFDLKSKLRLIMSSPKFALISGIVLFTLLLNNSSYTDEYLSCNDHVLLPE